jgi:hypothetical protein
MNKLLQTTAAVLLLPLFLQAKVIESSVYADILPYMDSQTLTVTHLPLNPLKKKSKKWCLKKIQKILILIKELSIF